MLRLAPLLSHCHRRTTLGTIHRLYSNSTSPLVEVQHDSDNFGTYNVILPDEPFVFGVSHIKPRTVPSNIARPHYARSAFREGKNESPNLGRDGRIKLGSDSEVKLRNAGRLAKDVREFACSLVREGVTTDDIDSAVHNFIISHSAYPSPLLYNGFPKACCTSINNVLVHGIPDDRPLQSSDIINIDITVFKDGFHGDTSQTFAVGPAVDTSGRALISLTNAALEAGISACGPGRPFKGIGRAIHALVVKENSRTDQDGRQYCISQHFTGHGIGEVFHSPPWILHHLNDEPGVMLPGHCFTIEPCIVQGIDPHAWIFPDGWTASTENCARGAQAEHTVLITEDGVDILTR